jgi:hypothetical protein
MGNQLVAGAKPYCLWDYSAAVPSGDQYAFTMCDLDYHEKLEDAKKRTTCPLCDRPIQWKTTSNDAGAVK